MFLLFIGDIALMSWIFSIWNNNVSDILVPFGFIIFLLGFFGFYFFWLFLFGYGFNLLDSKSGYDSKFKTFNIVLLVSLLAYLIGISIEIHYLFNLRRDIPDIFNLLLGVIILYCFLHIIIVLTRNYKYYDTGEDPRFINYIGNALLICFIPIGLIIMHAHLKSILKEKSLID